MTQEIVEANVHEAFLPVHRNSKVFFLNLLYALVLVAIGTSYLPPLYQLCKALIMSLRKLQNVEYINTFFPQIDDGINFA